MTLTMREVVLRFTRGGIDYFIVPPIARCLHPGSQPWSVTALPASSHRKIPQARQQMGWEPTRVGEACRGGHHVSVQEMGKSAR